MGDNGMDKNVMIPLSLLKQVADLLEYWDTSGYAEDFRRIYADALWHLKVKLQKLELRDAYAKIISAKDDDARHDARIEYLWLKNRIGDVDLPF